MIKSLYDFLFYGFFMHVDVFKNNENFYSIGELSFYKKNDPIFTPLLGESNLKVACENLLKSISAETKILEEKIDTSCLKLISLREKIEKRQLVIEDPKKSHLSDLDADVIQQFQKCYRAKLPKLEQELQENQNRLVTLEKMLDLKKADDKRITHFCREKIDDSSAVSSFKVARRGMQNSGNSCYMASVLQSLLRVPQMVEKIFSRQEQSESGLEARAFLKKFFDANESKKSFTASQTESLRSFFRDKGWKVENSFDQMEDAAVFLEFLLSQLGVAKFPATTRMNPVPKGEDHLLTVFLKNHTPISIQELVSTKNILASENSRKPYKLFAENVPEILPVVIEGRTKEDSNKNRTKIFPSKQLILPLQGKQDESVTYNLTSVVIYKGQERNGGHYFTCVQEDGKWVEYNDEKVTVHQNSSKIEEMIEKDSYLFFYSLVNS